MNVAAAPGYDVQASWTGFRWPLTGPAVLDSARGKLEARGWREFAWRVDGEFEPAGAPPFSGNATGRFTTEQIVVEESAWQVLGGRVALQATLARDATRRGRSAAARETSTPRNSARTCRAGSHLTLRDRGPVSTRTRIGRHRSGNSAASSADKRSAVAAAFVEPATRRSSRMLRSRSVPRSSHSTAGSAAMRTSMPAWLPTTCRPSFRSSAGRWMRHSWYATGRLQSHSPVMTSPGKHTGRSSFPRTRAFIATGRSIPGCACVPMA